LLEAVARLFTQNVRVSVYPRAVADVQKQAGGLIRWIWKETDGMVSADNLHIDGPQDLLYQYLLSKGFVMPAIRAKK
jgi:hypothetical protein